MKFLSLGKHRLFRNAALVVLIVLGAKYVAHEQGWEVVVLNPLITGLIAANVFLMGFLLNGVLSDYKESERLPGELACCLDTLADEAATSWGARRDAASRDFLAALSQVAERTVAWFYKKAGTDDLLAAIAALNPRLQAYESLLPANFVVRLRQEQNNLRRMIIRIHTIRETSFIPSGYVISEVVTLVLLGGLVFAQVTPFHDSILCVGLITFLFSFMGLLIRDLDNPFGYYEDASSEDVSLKPVTDTVARLRGLAAECDPAPRGS